MTDTISDETLFSCPTCDGTCDIDDTEHPDHPNNTGDGAEQNWCIDCDGSDGVSTPSQGAKR